MRRWTWIAVCVLGVAGVAGVSPALAQEGAEAPMEVEAEEGAGEGAMDTMPEGPAIPWEEQVETFFGHVEAGEPEEAIDTLYANNPWASVVSEQLVTLREQFGGLSELVGAYQGNELLAVQPISERFVYVWYMGFYERQPLQFHFSFYKPGDRWLLYQLSYEEGVVALAQELARREMAEGN
jgi:hypothetical protein